MDGGKEMTKGDDPIESVTMQQTGDNTFRPSKPGEKTNYQHQSTGLTKREYFTCKAMQGYLSCDIDAGNEITKVKETAKWSVKMADALIEALNNQQ